MKHDWIHNLELLKYQCARCGGWAKDDATYYATCTQFVGDNNRTEPDPEILRALGHNLK